MAKILVLLFSILISAEGNMEYTTIDKFFDASERCATRNKLSPAYGPQIKNFLYPDVPEVHRHIQCVATELGLWNNYSGFKIDRIASMYNDRANMEILIPILSECNRNRFNEAPAKWCYSSFKCILESRIGTWFKTDLLNH